MAVLFQHYIMIHYVPSIGHPVSSASAYWLLLGGFTARAIPGDIILLICQYFPCWWQKRRTIKIYEGLTSQKKGYAHQLYYSILFTYSHDMPILVGEIPIPKGLTHVFALRWFLTSRWLSPDFRQRSCKDAAGGTVILSPRHYEY